MSFDIAAVANKQPALHQPPTLTPCGIQGLLYTVMKWLKSHFNSGAKLVLLWNRQGTISLDFIYPEAFKKHIFKAVTEGLGALTHPMFSRLPSLCCGRGSRIWWAPPSHPKGGADGWCCVRVPGHPGCHEVPSSSTHCARLVTAACIHEDWERYHLHTYAFQQKLIYFLKSPCLKRNVKKKKMVFNF